MKKIFVIALIAVFTGTILSGCEKEKIPSEKKVCNPYDFLGELHNKAMDKVYASALNDENIDIYNFSMDYVLNQIQIENPNSSMSELQKLLQEITPELIAHNNISNNPIDFSTSFYVNSFTTQQISMLQEFYDELDKIKDANEIPIIISKYENLVFEKNISNEEKMPLLGTLAISKYSYQFFINNFSDTKQARPKWSEICLRVVKADGLGFLSGVAWSSLKHIFIAGMTFGPEGAVAAIAAAGLDGAIVGSGTEIIVIIKENR